MMNANYCGEQKAIVAQILLITTEIVPENEKNREGN
jgi:hypothetical protein